MSDKKLFKSLVDIRKYERKGIYHSELYMFWQLVRTLKVDRIVESGTYHGLTANRLEALFPECEIITFEYREDRWNVAKKRCNPRIDVRLGKLDKSVLTPTTAVIIDGPKWMTAIELASEIIDSVALCCIHDMYSYLNELEKRFNVVCHSGKPNSDIKQLDKHIPAETIKRNNRKGYYGTVLACVRAK
jgi:tRNA A58 N-methylase Trm61